MLEDEVVQYRQEDAEPEDSGESSSPTGAEDQDLSRVTDSGIISKLKVIGLLGVTANSEGKV